MKGFSLVSKLIQKKTGFLDKKSGFSREKWRKYMAAREMHLKVGIVGKDAKEVHADSGLTNAQLGSIHEYGTSSIPARPFISSTIRQNKDKYVRVIREALQKNTGIEVSFGKISRDMRRVGMQAVADIKKRMTNGSGIPPPLAASTLAAKRAKALAANTKKTRKTFRPLVDTGQMMRAISYILVGKGGKLSGKGAKE